MNYNPYNVNNISPVTYPYSNNNNITTGYNVNTVKCNND